MIAQDSLAAACLSSSFIAGETFTPGVIQAKMSKIWDLLIKFLFVVAVGGNGAVVVVVIASVFQIIIRQNAVGKSKIVGHTAIFVPMLSACSFSL